MNPIPSAKTCPTMNDAPINADLERQHADKRSCRIAERMVNNHLPGDAWPAWPDVFLPSTSRIADRMEGERRPTAAPKANAGSATDRSN
jgi:hypothetical protein